MCAGNPRLRIHRCTVSWLTADNVGTVAVDLELSCDGGATWSDWSPFSFVGHAPDLLRLENGVLLSAFREINDAFTQEWVSYMYSITESATWSPVTRVESCGAAECGYPSLLELDDAFPPLSVDLEQALEGCLGASRREHLTDEVGMGAVEVAGEHGLLRRGL